MKTSKNLTVAPDKLHSMTPKGAIATEREKTSGNHTEPKLQIPDDVKAAHILDCFFQNSRTVTYSDRLFAAGFKVVGDLSGKTETEIRRKARTTESNWQGFKWALGTYGAHFH